MYSLFFKRIFDLCGACLLLVFVSPIILFASLAVLLKMGHPIFFRQLRPGKDEKIFEIYKFRSMDFSTCDDGNMLSDEERLTPIGRFLRKTSIDELPQLLNVIKGDMSFIGPRPLLTQYLPYYSEDEKHRHDVRPGITGLAQVMGRNNISWDEKLKFDVEYVKNVSLMLDIRIFFLTIKNILMRKDVQVASSEGFLDEVRRNIKE